MIYTLQIVFCNQSYCETTLRRGTSI